MGGKRGSKWQRSVIVSYYLENVSSYTNLNTQMGNICREIEICNEIDHWFTANHCYCQARKEQATIGLYWSECFCFPFIANISNAIMSNQNAQIQRKIYEMYRTQMCSLCKISKKALVVSRLRWASPLFLLFRYSYTHVRLSLNFPAKAHSTPSFSTPAFSTPATWCHVFHSRDFSAPIT